LSRFYFKNYALLRTPYAALLDDCVFDECVLGRVRAYRPHDQAMFQMSIFDRDYLEIAFRERAHADFVSNLPRDITS
jgi:hypothetical protein